MGRTILNSSATASSKLVATGEYIMSQLILTGNTNNTTIYSYNYSKQKAADETYLYMTAQWNSLEAYSYAPVPCIHCLNQTADKFNGSQYHFGYQDGSEREFNLHTAQNYAHSETLDGRSGNISSSNFGVGTVPIIINFNSANNSGNRPGHTHCPNARAGGQSDGNLGNPADSRGESVWYGYLRVWELAY